MDGTSGTTTGIQSTTTPMSLVQYEGDGVFVVELEIPDITDITSVSFKFGTNLTSAYKLGVVTSDINGNPLANGLNVLRFDWAALSTVGTVDASNVTEWQILINHDTDKVAVEKFKLSDLRITRPMFLTFKYLFYRVGKTSAGTDIIEFTADTDVPFFVERYPQYRFAVAHKAAAVMYRMLQLPDDSRAEAREASNALDRYRKNFSGERDMPSSQFKVAGISFRNRRIIRRK
jgi:hypothetical protein